MNAGGFIASGRLCAVVFDMDGVLIDSEPLFRTAAKRAAGELGYQLSDEVYVQWMGLPPKAVEAAVRQSMGDDFPMEPFRETFREVWIKHTDEHGVPAQPGMYDLLDKLRQHEVPYAVATSTFREQALRSLELAGLGSLIDVVVAGDEVVNGKPAPDIFLAAAEAIQVAPTGCIAIEDSAVGVRAAAEANMMTIMVPDLHQPDNATASLAHYVLRDTITAGAVVSSMLNLP